MQHTACSMDHAVFQPLCLHSLLLYLHASLHCCQKQCCSSSIHTTRLLFRLFPSLRFCLDSGPTYIRARTDAHRSWGSVGVDLQRVMFGRRTFHRSFHRTLDRTFHRTLDRTFHRTLDRTFRRSLTRVTGSIPPLSVDNGMAMSTERSLTRRILQTEYCSHTWHNPCADSVHGHRHVYRRVYRHVHRHKSDDRCFRRSTEAAVPSDI